MTTTRAPWHVRAARKYGQSAVLYAALALSAPGEYALATMAGWDARVAWLMPAVMSLYAAIGASVAKSQKEAARRALGTPTEAEAKRRAKNATSGALLALMMATAAQIAEHVLTTGATGARAWVVIIVSAVPPLVAAHVLHIDPPMDPADVDDAAQLPALEPQTAAVEPPAKRADEETPEPENAPEPPILRSYAEVAEALNVAPETVRGWANNGTVKKYPGLTAHTRRVDLRECKAVQARRQLVGA
ncbi:hypothetical protein ACQEVG_33025 [Streptomyces sp. CA-135486]|uniref:hypothetical protein n=1 Tax=Streptomyces sp. CA-135486 TaxID=3240049 RepID=UPI003D911926